MSQPEFLESYKRGEQIFKNKSMQFFDISNLLLDGVKFASCSLFFCTLRNTALKNVSFENCTIYNGSFYTGTADNLVFENCSIELTLFDSFQFSRTAFRKCNMQWCGFLNSNHASIDLSTSAQFKTITDLSQVTPADIDYLISVISQKIERLDMDMRLKVKELIRADIERYKLKSPGEKQGMYSADVSDPDAPLTYSETKGLVEGFFYGAQSPYKAKKHVYETKGGYKK